MMHRLATITSVFLTTLLTVVILSPVWADDLTMEQCIHQLEACDKSIAKHKAQILDLEKYKQQCDADIGFMKKDVQGALESVVDKCKQGLALRDEHIKNLEKIDTTLTENRQQCFDRLEETMAHYRDCVEESTEPWYKHALFYIGLLLGIAIGVPITI